MEGINPRLFDDRSPGVEDQEPTANLLTYTTGLVLALLLTVASFAVSQTNLLWEPGIPVGLIALALAQIGVHLIFFLHIGFGPEHTNNVVALAFGVWIILLVIAGSVGIMANLSYMMPMSGNMPH
jgi:cytochrome o ubiquinol oxidase subunit IV